MSTNQAALVKAGQLLNERLEKVQKNLDLADFLKGMTSQNYIHSLLGSSTQRLMQPHSIEFPPKIAQAFEASETVTTFQGLLTDINCVWITMDNILYLWQYKEGEHVYIYGDQDQIICDVGLVKPKQGIFEDHIHHLLVVTTPLNIILLTVGYDPWTAHRPGSKIEIGATRLVVTCDDNPMSSIQGSDNGRIFMCGKDGHLYEFDYSLKSGKPVPSLVAHTIPLLRRYLPILPFTRQPNLGFSNLVIDSERSVLYALLEDQTIEIFDLGPTKTGFTSISKNDNIVNSIKSTCQRNSIRYDPSAFHIDHLHVVSQTESRRIHIIAVTKCGYRLYFTNSLRTNYNSNPSCPPTITNTPNALYLMHIRSPPVITTTTTTSTTTATSSTQHASPLPETTICYQDGGVLLASQTHCPETDNVYMISASIELSPQNQSSQDLTLVEIISESKNLGRVWDMAEEYTSGMRKQPICDMASQLTDEARRFLVLSDQGLVFLNQQRPVDTLYNIVAKPKSATYELDCRAFFNRYGSIEACAMCISIVCACNASNAPDSEEIKQQAIMVYVTLGGAPSALGSLPLSYSNHLGQAVGQMNILYSSKHDGLVLYLARILRDAWKTNVFEIIPGRNQTCISKRLQSTLPTTKTNLLGLKGFMESYINLKPSQGDDHGTLQLLLAEHQSVTGFHNLINKCAEALILIDTFIKPDVQDIMQCVPESLGSSMMGLSLETMVSSSRGTVLKNELVIAAIIHHACPSDLGHSHVVSDILQTNCPSLFEESEFVFYKGLEALCCARQTKGHHDRALALEESLEHLQGMAGIIPDDRFNDICMEYRRLDYNVGVLKLSLERAEKLDPNGDALEYVEDHLTLIQTPTSEPTPTDPRLHLYQLRLRCYNQITMCFSGNDQLDLLLSAARSSKDRLFHYALYQWLFHQFKNGNGGEAELLLMGPDYIIDFFTNYVDFVDGFEFLAVYCRYWNKRYESALHYETLALEHPSKCPSIQAKYLGLALTQIKMAMDEAPAPKSIDLYHRLKQHLEDLRRGEALG